MPVPHARESRSGPIRGPEQSASFTSWSLPRPLSHPLDSKWGCRKRPGLPPTPHHHNGLWGGHPWSETSYWGL